MTTTQDWGEEPDSREVAAKWQDGGQYDAVAVASAMGKSQAGHPTLAVRFVVEGVGTISWYGSFSENAYPFTVEALQALGWDPASNNYAFGVLAEENFFAGAKANITVKHDEYEGKWKWKVAWVNPLGGGALFTEKLSKADAESFEAMLRAGVRSGKLVTRQRQAAAPAVAQRTAASPQQAHPAIAGQQAARAAQAQPQTKPAVPMGRSRQAAPLSGAGTDSRGPTAAQQNFLRGTPPGQPAVPGDDVNFDDIPF